MNRDSKNNSLGGFSLIEVLIAVAVLAFGLLALASLQVTLIRSAAETKAQSVGLSLAKDQVEDMRSFQGLPGYHALTSLAPASAQTFAAGGVDYSRWWTVTRYAFNPTTNTFAEVANTGPTPSGFDSNNEFKRIRVSVSWADASGATRTTSLEDAIAALDPSDSAKLAKMRGAVTPRKPQVLIFDPSNTAGVIPIAIGPDSATAATNPSPEVAGRGTNNQRVVETRFEILTYSGLNNTNKLAQSRVETAVIGCTCDTSQGSGLGTPKRPSYWNGERYMVPVDAAYAAPAGPALNPPTPQSRLCTICCRDHHDNNAGVTRVAASEPKFSPRRTSASQHAHNQVSFDSSGDLVLTPVTTGVYSESCRVVRVDGIFRVAADLYNDSTNVLGANNPGINGYDSSKPPYVPLMSYQQVYAGTFSSPGLVLNYINGRYSATTSNSSTYNTFAAANAIASTTLQPDPLPMTKSWVDTKWMHARGLYMDFLEGVAIARIDKAKADCAARTPTACSIAERQAAVLSLIPFTSINLSEVANWASYDTATSTEESNDYLSVSMDEFIASAGSDAPVRGMGQIGVVPPKNANPVATPRAEAIILRSNSGLALLDSAINSDETQPKQDRQSFRLEGSAVAEGGYFLVALPDYLFSASTASYPRLFSSNPAARCTYNTKGSLKSRYTCATYVASRTAPVTLSPLTIGRYNYQDSSRTSTAAMSCGGGDPVSYSGPAYPVNYCKNFRVTAVSVIIGNNTVVVPAAGISVGTFVDGTTTEGSVAEYTTITVPDVPLSAKPNNNPTVSITLVPDSPAETMMPSTCTYTAVIGATTTYKFTVAPTPCR